MPPAKHTSTALRAQSAQSLKLYDCLIEVTRAGTHQAALFWLSAYLRKTTGLNQDGMVKCSLLSYSRFQNDIHTHFNYDADIDEIQWENTTSLSGKVKSENESGPSNPTFTVLSHNSWVTALLAMQSMKFSAQSPVPGVRAKSPCATAVTFTIVRKENADEDDTTDTETDTDTDTESDSGSEDGIDNGTRHTKETEETLDVYETGVAN